MKRFTDILISASALVLLSPIIVILSWKIRKNLGSPILFRQIRPGLNGKPFEMIKFRSMKDAVDKDGNQLPNNERLTSFGKKLRSSSLDELPEFWNVLKGDMSLIGPRPLLMEYLPLYTQEQNRRHDIRPGVTGWAQINGRNAISWQDKFKLDVWYIEHQSLWLDIKIIFLTVKKIIIKEGVNASSDITMEKFTGNK
ncbi:sugar transferase [Photobacterium phosphoreum]|uniref:sugar transferase n=1 Tax=Photobacterium phosphoreum TaxID=659 RepID=UPI002FCD3617|nr:sugar transferase [Photobacterium phosphoreum]